MAELARRGVAVTGATQILVNAVVVTATRETAAELRSIAGVKYIVPVGKARPTLDRAVNLMNVPAAWAAVGGESQAGAGIKIGIIDSGIDQNHAGFQDSSLQPPAGFPKGDAAYTNSKVIVARSYVQKDLAPGYAYDPEHRELAATSQPDDYSPRDRMGHGTAIAMIAARGAEHRSPGLDPGRRAQGVPRELQGVRLARSQRLHQFPRRARRARRCARRRHGCGNALDDRRRPEHVRRAARQPSGMRRRVRRLLGRGGDRDQGRDGRGGRGRE